MVSNVTFSVFDFHTSTAPPPAHMLTRDLHWGVSPQTSTSQIQQVTFRPNMMLLQGFLVSVTTINLVSQAKTIGIISYCFLFFSHFLHLSNHQTPGFLLRNTHPIPDPVATAMAGHDFYNSCLPEFLAYTLGQLLSSLHKLLLQSSINFLKNVNLTNPFSWMASHCSSIRYKLYHESFMTGHPPP